MNQPDNLARMIAELQQQLTPPIPPKTVLERKLEGYKDPASDGEQDRQARAERMVKAAVNGWQGLVDTTVNFIVKGSYANNTNVKSDSDVDIAAIYRGMHYFNDAALLPQHKIIRVPISVKHYPGLQFRQHIEQAAIRHFGAAACDVTGNTAVTVAENGGRVSADLVPSFLHHTYYYDANGNIRSHEGTITFRKDGSTVINYPNQQLNNGVAKNIATGYRYKQLVRILKRLENELVATGKIKELPSYFMECLVHAVPNDWIGSKSANPLTDDLKSVLGHIVYHTSDANGQSHTWTEPNGIKPLFHASQPWTKQDATNLAALAWGHLRLS